MPLGIYNSAAFLTASGVAVAPNADIEVRRESDSGLAPIFSDRAGASPITQPGFQADALGRFTFYAAGLSGGYQVKVTKGAETHTLRNVAIGTGQEFDIDEFWRPILAAANASLIAGKSAIPIPVTALTPRSANGCAPLATSNGAANQPDVDYLAFDGVVKEFARFCMQMPKSWNEGTVTANFSWRRASGVAAADVVWGIRAAALSDNETPLLNFGADAIVTDAASLTTANMNISAETAACTIGGTPAENDLVFFEVFRDGAAAGDTLNTVDAWLTHVTLFLTMNAMHDA